MFVSKLYRQLIQGKFYVGSDKTCKFDQSNIKEIRPICLYKCSHSLQEIQKLSYCKIGKKKRKYVNKNLIEKQTQYSQEKNKRLKAQIKIRQQEQCENEIYKNKNLPKGKRKSKLSELQENASQQIATKVQLKSNLANLQKKQIKQQSEVVSKNVPNNAKQGPSKGKSKQSKKDIQKKQMEKQSKFLSGWISKSKTT